LTYRHSSTPINHYAERTFSFIIIQFALLCQAVFPVIIWIILLFWVRFCVAIKL